MPIFLEKKLNIALLKEIKEGKKLTQQDIVELTEKYYSLSKSMIDFIMTKGNDNVTMETLIKLCVAFNITPNQLVINPESDNGSWDSSVVAVVNKEMQVRLAKIKNRNGFLETKVGLIDAVMKENNRLRKVINRYLVKYDIK